MKKPRNKIKQYKSDDKNHFKYFIGLGMLMIMLVSIVGFVYVGSGDSSINNNYLPFGKYDIGNGKEVYATILNKEQIIFENYEGFENRSDLQNFSQNFLDIKKFNLYFDKNLTSQNTILFFFDKLQRAKEINYNLISNLKCDELTIVLKTNISNENYENLNKENCKILNLNEDNPSRDIENLLFFIVQNPDFIQENFYHNRHY